MGKSTSALVTAETLAERNTIISASHAVLSFAAFLEATDLDPVILEGITTRDLQKATSHQFELTIPSPSTTTPQGQMVDAMRPIFRELGRRLSAFLKGLAQWDSLNESQAGDFERRLNNIDAIAVETYTAMYLTFVAQVPELFLGATVSGIWRSQTGT